MLMRISLIVAIIAGLAAGILSFVKVKEKIDIVVAERNDWHGKYDVTYDELNTTKSTLAKTEKELTKTKDTLAQTEQERDAAVTEAEIQIKKSTELTEKLAKTIQERDDYNGRLNAYEATGFTPPQILALGKQIKQTQDELEATQEEKKILQIAYEKTKAKLDWITGEVEYVTLKPDLQGKILVTDPKWEFVVIDVGQDEGAKLNGELLVSRAGKLVAKVIISDVQKGRCIANVMPGWKLGDVSEGDQVIPAHPES